MTRKKKKKKEKEKEKDVNEGVGKGAHTYTERQALITHRCHLAGIGGTGRHPLLVRQCDNANALWNGTHTTLPE